MRPVLAILIKGAKLFIVVYTLANLAWYAVLFSIKKGASVNIHLILKFVKKMFCLGS